MARGDIQISLETNDLKIEKTTNETFATTTWMYDGASDTVVISVVVPNDIIDRWKTYNSAIKTMDKIDNTYDTKLIYAEYVYLDSDGLPNQISRLKLGFSSPTQTFKYLNVEEFNKLIDSTELVDENLVFNYDFDEVVTSIAATTEQSTITLNIWIDTPFSEFTVDWGDGVIETITGEFDLTDSHTYTDNLKSHVIKVEGDLTIVTRIDFEDQLITGLYLPAGLINLTVLKAGNCLLTSLIIPYTLVLIENIQVQGNTSLNTLVIPDTLEEFGQLNASDCDLSQFYISRFWKGAVTGIDIRLGDSSLNKSGVNNMLNELVSSVSNDVAFHIDLSGNNSQPDETSGGLNGIESFWKLRDAGHTVLIDVDPPRLEQYKLPTTVADGRIDRIAPPIPDGVGTKFEYVIVNPLHLGDFVIEDYIPQNEYILLNANEGSFLQNPLQGVGLMKYLQSPSTSEEMINEVIEKFANDALRVLGIRKNGDNLTIETEDYNKK